MITRFHWRLICAVRQDQKKRVKGKSATSGSLLSTMSSESRHRFAERANSAQERRHEIAINLKKSSFTLTNPMDSKELYGVTRHKNKQKNFRYWLVSASLKEILILLFFGKSKHT